MVQALGLEETDPAEALAWYGAIVAEVTAITAGAAPDGSGREAFARLCSSVEPALDRHPSSSLVAAAARTGGLTRAQVASNAAVLLFGGIETTEAMIANAFLHLLSNPSQQALVEAEPALLAAAVEESLRLEPAAAVVDRYVTRDTELAGVQLASAGTSSPSRSPAPIATPPCSPSPTGSTCGGTTSASRLASPTALTCAWACTSRGSRRAWPSSAPSHGCRGSASTRLARPLPAVSSSASRRTSGPCGTAAPW